MGQDAGRLACKLLVSSSRASNWNSSFRTESCAYQYAGLMNAIIIIIILVRPSVRRSKTFNNCILQRTLNVLSQLVYISFRGLSAPKVF